MRIIRVHSDRVTETDTLDGVMFGAEGLLLTHRSDNTLRALESTRRARSDTRSTFPTIRS